MKPSAAEHRVVLLVVALVTAAGAVQAQTPFDDRLSGNWGGVRSSLADHGVTFELESASYYQGLLSAR
jgi:carbohydrate-selective porin OprB